MGHDNDRRQPRPRRKFSDEFKRDAVELVLTTGLGIAEVAGEFGVYDSTLGNWVRQHQERERAGSGVSPDERARLKELEAENAELRLPTPSPERPRVAGRSRHPKGCRPRRGCKFVRTEPSITPECECADGTHAATHQRGIDCDNRTGRRRRVNRWPQEPQLSARKP
jgi:transposase